METLEIFWGLPVKSTKKDNPWIFLKFIYFLTSTFLYLVRCSSGSARISVVLGRVATPFQSWLFEFNALHASEYFTFYIFLFYFPRFFTFSFFLFFLTFFLALPLALSGTVIECRSNIFWIGFCFWTLNITMYVCACVCTNVFQTYIYETHNDNILYALVVI